MARAETERVGGEQAEARRAHAAEVEALQAELDGARQESDRLGGELEAERTRAARVREALGAARAILAEAD